MDVKMTHRKTGKSFVIKGLKGGIGWHETWDDKKIKDNAWEIAREDSYVDSSDSQSDYDYSVITKSAE